MSAHCQKVLNLNMVNPQGALMFLKLREHSLPRGSSVRTAARLHCRSDTSRNEYVHPTADVRFPIESSKFENRDITKGWVSGNLTFDLGSRHNKAVVKEESEFSNLYKIERHLAKVKEKKEKKHDQNMGNLREFLESQVESKLKGRSGLELLQEVGSIVIRRFAR